MDIQYESKLRNDLLQAWNEGNGEINAIELCAGILSHRMRADQDVARFHFNAVKNVAQGLLPVCKAHMILHDCYRRGWGVTADPKKALRHLELAIENGHEVASWFLACYLINDDKLAPVLPPDPERAMTIFRNLIRNSKNVDIIELALPSAASYIAQHFSIQDVSGEDLELVDRYSEWTTSIRSMDHLYLALFYATGATDTDYAGPSYRKSRELLMAGSKRSEQVRALCNAQLDAWNVRPKSETAPALTTSQKAGQVIKVTGMAGGMIGVLVMWSLIGTFLLSVTVAINAAVIPLIIGVVVVGLVIKFLARR